MKNVRQTLPVNMSMSVVSNYSEIDYLIRNRCGIASWTHLKFGTFTAEDAKRWPEFKYKASSTCVEKSCKNQRFCAKGVPKSTKIVSRTAPKAVLEASRFWDPQKVPTPAARHTHLGTIWLILGAVLATAGRQRIPKSSVLAPGMPQNLKI